jgi:hypothetical protein
MTLSTLPDVGQLQNSKWRPAKQEVEITSAQSAGVTTPTAVPTYATKPDKSMTLPILPDVIGWLLEFKMAATKPEAEITLKRQVIATRFQLLSPFAAMPDLDTTLLSADVGRLPKFKLA